MSDRRILILELGGIGDAVLAFPAVQSLLKHYDGAYIKVLVVPRTLPAMQFLKYRTGTSFVIEPVDLDSALAAWLDLVRRLRAEDYDTIIDLSAIGSFKAAVKRFAFLRALGAGELLGRDTDKRGWAFTRKTSEVLLSEEHEVERKLKVARLAGAGMHDTAVRFDGYRNSGTTAQKDGRIVGINIGAYRPSRRWPIDKVIALAREMLHENRIELVFLGGEKEKDLLATIQDALNDHAAAIRMACNLEFEDLVVLLSELSLLITNDTAVMHIGADLGIPMVVTFDQNNVHRYRPYMEKENYVLIKKDADVCPHFKFSHKMQECPRYSCATQECMNLITVEEVKNAAKRLL